jgi:hypothetical protein
VADFLTYWLQASLVTARRRREQHGRSSAVPHNLGPGDSLPHLLRRPSSPPEDRESSTVGHQLFLTTWVQVAAFLIFWFEASLVTARRKKEQHGRSSADLTTWVQAAAILIFWLEAFLLTVRMRRKQHGRSSALPHYLHRSRRRLSSPTGL